ncbi:hypothetical protein BDN72DRAFT_801082 [Pluteus cervinus]|uniref:Uncharacterized protein n=1 Tax=Pluteus cervinus TaxID=181527 RepID=A0ACD3AJ12_9AGAR|nr:hypothetical protein BDN72DRAFT_801082 [Pluteus cervinus]
MQSTKRKSRGTASGKSTVVAEESRPSTSREVGNTGDDESVLSDGEDLRDDINRVLSKFTFDGAFGVSESFPSAPSPGLVIEGIGSIGLPLKEGDATRICALSESGAQPHKGAKEASKKAKDLKAMWEVHPSKISFKNTSWASYVEKAIVPFVCKGLGLVVTPTCELSKLSLYGSHSSSQLTETAQLSEGVFATIAILLPSRYTGGRICISHASETAEVDLPKGSNLRTNIIAWYLEAQRVVQPIESGYQLTLSYNLVHNIHNQPIPSIPSTDELSRTIRHILQKWENNKYPRGEGTTADPLVYLLKDHQQHMIANGVTTLSGRDAHKVKTVQRVAEKLGFVVYLGNLELVIRGFPEDTRYLDYYSPPRKRSRYDYDYYGMGYGDSDEDMSSEDDYDPYMAFSGRSGVDMEEETERTLRITLMAKVDGGRIGTSEFDIKETSIVQKNPFNGVDPDERKGGDMGRSRCAGNQLEYYYRRSVLILLRKENVTDFLFSAYGPEHALRTLEEAEILGLSPEFRRLADSAIGKLTPNTKHGVEGLAKAAISWNNLPMWEALCKNVGYNIGKVGPENYGQAVAKFSFKKLRPCLEQCLTETADITEQLALLSSISAQLSPEGSKAEAWCRDQRLKSLQDISEVTVESIPYFIEIMKVDGVATIMDIIRPQLQAQTIDQDFSVAFVKGLHDPYTESSSSGGREAWNLAIRESLQAAVGKWVKDYKELGIWHPMSGGYRYMFRGDGRVDTSLELLDLCLLVGHPSSFQPVLDCLINASGCTAEKFEILYRPFFSSFTETLARHNIAVTTSPFANFSRRLIGMYLRDLLGPSSTLFSPSWTPMCSNACAECPQVSEFLSSARAELQVKVAKAGRTHVEGQLSSLQATMKVTVTLLKVGSPHSLLIKKSAQMVAGYKWENRLAKAKEFLGQFGDEKSISSIMGNAYGDVLSALGGVTVFGRTDQELAVCAPVVPSASTSAGGTMPTTSAQSTGPKKKKKAKTRSRPFGY